MDLKDLIMVAFQVSILATVFGFGLEATFDDVLFLWRRPGLLSRSLVAMFVGMPLAALAVVSVMDLPANVKVPLLALSIAPLPPLIPRRLAKAGGRPEYAIALMATLALLALVITPLGVFLFDLWFGQPFAMPQSQVVKMILVTVIVPLVAGVTVRTLLPVGARRIVGPVLLVGRVLLPLAVLGLLTTNIASIWALVGSGAVLSIAAFVAAGLLIGHLLGGPAEEERVVLALATASRHPAIALAISVAGFPEEKLGATILLYLVLSTIFTVPYTVWQRRKLDRAMSVSPAR